MAKKAKGNSKAKSRAQSHAKRHQKPAASRVPRVYTSAPSPIEQPKRRGRRAKEMPDYSGVECSADTRAYEFHIPVKFGGSASARGRGDKGTRTIGVKVRRGEMDAKDAGKVFVGTALSSCMRANPGSRADVAGQQMLGESVDVELCAVAQSGSLNESPKWFGATLCFSKASVSGEQLERFVGLDGTLHCTVLKAKTDDASDSKDDPS